MKGSVIRKQQQKATATKSSKRLLKGQQLIKKEAATEKAATDKKRQRRSAQLEKPHYPEAKATAVQNVIFGGKSSGRMRENGGGARQCSLRGE